MKDKAIKIIESYENKTNAFYLHTVDKIDVINMMLEFGHYVAEEQKKQCLKEVTIDKSYYQTHGRDSYTAESNEVNKDSILNSKNVCNEQ